jgi:hypothetical protein
MNNKPAVTGTTWLTGLFGAIGSILLLMIVVWLAIKFANGPGGSALKGVGDSIGRYIAGTYSLNPAAEQARRAAAAAPKPEPKPEPKAPAPRNDPVVLAPNLLGESREEFTARRRREAKPAGTGLA